MISKKKENDNKVIKINGMTSEEEFIKFFKIDMKTDEELSRMSKPKKRQYESRIKRWHSLLTTQIDYEIFKSLKMFGHLDEAIDLTKHKLTQIRTDPEFDTKYDAKFKKELDKTEADTKEMLKQLTNDRQAFDDVYIPYKKQRAQQLLEIKTEKTISDLNVESKDDTDVDIKEDYNSDEEDIEEEYISEVNSKPFGGVFFSSNDGIIDDKSAVQREIKTEFNVKKEIKTEIKTEIKFEIKTEIKSEVKTEFDDKPMVGKVEKEFFGSE